MHISTVKSTELDTWKKEWYETMKEWGNEKVNKLWEYSLPENSSAKPNETESQNLSAKHKQFIRDKYEKKLWYKPQKISKSNGKSSSTSKKKSTKESDEESSSSSSSSSDNEDSDSSSDSAPKSKSKGKSTTKKQKETTKASSTSATTKQTTKSQPAASKAKQSSDDNDLFGFGAFSEPVAAVTAGMSTMHMAVPTASVAAPSAIPTAIPVDAPPAMQPKKTIDLASLYSASVPQYAPMGGMPGMMYPPQQQIQGYPGMMPVSYQAPQQHQQQQQTQQYPSMMMYPPQAQQPMMYQQPGQSSMMGYPVQQQPQQTYYQQQVPMMSIPTQPAMQHASQPGFGMMPTTANKNDPFSGLY